MAIITNEGISYKPSLLDRITSKHIIEIYQKQEEFYRKQGDGKEIHIGESDIDTCKHIISSLVDESLTKKG